MTSGRLSTEHAQRSPKWSSRFIYSRRPRGWWAQTFLKGLISLAIVGLSLVPIARFIGIALARMGYPFELEWIEGGSVSHIQIALSGQSIYRAPSMEFTPFIYPPLYYYVAALPSRVLGVGLFAPRLVSFSSMLGSLVLLAAWVRAETDDAVAGIAAAGLLISVFQLTGMWMDLARVDSLFLFITFAANVTARFTYTRRRAALVGALLAAACFTKQLGIPLVVPALAFLTLRSWRLGLVALLVTCGVAGGAALVFDYSSSGWFHYYLFQLPARHEVEWTRLWPETQTYFLGNTWPLTLAGIALLCGFGFSRRQRKQWLFVALFVLIGVTTSFLPFLKSGGYLNGLIPAYAALSLAAGIQFGALRRWQRESTFSGLGSSIFGALLVVYQGARLTYEPQVALPTDADLLENQRVLTRIKALPKPIWVTASSYWSLIGEPNGVPLHAAALSDVFKGGGRVADQLRIDMARAFDQHRFATIVEDRAVGFLPGDVVAMIERDYKPAGTVASPGVDAGWPKTGAAIRPDRIWIARKKPNADH